MSKHIILPFLALALTALASCGGHDEAGSDVTDALVVRARVVAAERLELPQTVQIRGTVEAAQVATVSSRVMATVAGVHAQLGDQVERGDLLLEIDPQTAEGQLAQARGALSQAQAGLALAERNFQRFQALAATIAASELEVDMARMQYEQARGAVDQARGAVAAASSVASESRVLAPFTGRVVRRMVEVGDLAAPGRPLFLIESGGAHRLAATVPETIMVRSELTLGDPVEVAIDARPDLGRVMGTVLETAPGADVSSHAFAVKIALPPMGLATGSAGRAWLVTGVRPAVVVPAAAILRHGGLELVVTRTAAGLTSTRAVTTGAAIGPDELEVLSGLAGGEEVLVGLGSLPGAGSRVEEEAAR